MRLMRCVCDINENVCCKKFRDVLFVGSSFAAKLYMSGQREGRTFLYKKDRYPEGAIGPALFTWKPYTSSPESGDKKDIKIRCLWIWVHPSIYNDLLEELKSVHCLHPVLLADDNNMKEPVKKRQKVSSEEKLTAHDALNCVNPVYKNSKIEVRSLKDAFCRYRLDGPLSSAILSSLLIPMNGASLKDQGIADNKWWNNYYTTEDSLKVHDLQQQFAKKLEYIQSPGELPSHAVLTLTVKDPRLLLPPKKTVIENEVIGKQAYH